MRVECDLRVGLLLRLRVLAVGLPHELQRRGEGELLPGPGRGGGGVGGQRGRGSGGGRSEAQPLQQLAHTCTRRTVKISRLLLHCVPLTSDTGDGLGLLQYLYIRQRHAPDVQKQQFIIRQYQSISVSF